MQDLLEILQEEADILEDDPDVPSGTENALRRVVAKLAKGDLSLTEPEKEAVKYALEDVGELYLFAGTSAGFEAEIVDSIPEARQRGRSAREQAHQLGVRL